MFFKIEQGEPVIDPDYLVIPSLKEYAKNVQYNPKTGVGDVKIERAITKYIYYVHHKRSQFHHMEKIHRKLSCSEDFFGDKEAYKKYEDNKVIRWVIKDMEKYQFTENEALLEGVRSKISEYIQFWNNTDITLESSVNIKSKVKDAMDLIKVRKELEQEVKKDMATGIDVDIEKDSFIERIQRDKARIYQEIVEAPLPKPEVNSN